MTTPDIDWEAKFHQQVSDNIRYKATASAKLAEAQLALDQANQRITQLEGQVRRLTPAGDELEKSVAARTREATEHYRSRQALREEIAALKEHQQRGQRAVLEDVISWLQQVAAKMPALDPAGEPG